MRKILVVFGTRPEAIKMCPLVLELRKQPSLQTIVCVTGQHREMLDQVLAFFNVAPDYDLSIMQARQTLFDITAKVMAGLRDVYEKEAPSAVLVHGDTPTTFAAALAAFYMQIPVGHVEAGLRTYDLYAPFPEEFDRQATGLIARWHFAPTENAKNNLLKEGKDPRGVYVTGNTVVDALKLTTGGSFNDAALDWAEGSRMVLLTAHRRENWGAPLERIFRGVRRVVEETPDVKVLFPLHHNPVVRQAAQILQGCSRIRLVEPVDVMTFHNYIARCHLILTDSGGIQEEASAFGKPVLVLRDVTERPEGVEAGTLKLVGTKEEAVYAGFLQLLTDKAEYDRMRCAASPYGDGHACARIVRALLDVLS
ncbi:MAG: UDP-N-acetylglucosamine 2-epimerase (non-hydrolyzing) [Candidatus Pelethousia sp.]|nr:UDP-N-acetylglucosamine 2-epimerase (non-hydrolyzing) [Candidatus Pelethousia sp.]